MTKKERELTQQQKDFLNALMGEAKGDFKTALKIAGYSENAKPSDIIKTLRYEILEAAQNALALNATKAVWRQADVMDDGLKPGASNILKAAQDILNRVGLTAKSNEVNLNVPSGGLLILPAKEKSVEESNNESEE